MTRLALALAFLAGPAVAQTPIICASYDDFTAALADRYGEQRQWTALDHRGGLLEGWANSVTGTWTVLVIGPDLRACMVASGPHYERAAGKEGEGS
jgi:hypothetical protein